LKLRIQKSKKLSQMDIPTTHKEETAPARLAPEQTQILDGLGQRGGRQSPSETQVDHAQPGRPRPDYQEVLSVYRFPPDELGYRTRTALLPAELDLQVRR
jgi:hypothetical protein